MGGFDKEKLKKFADENELTIQNYELKSLKQNEIFRKELSKEFF